MVYDEAGWWLRSELVTSPGFVADCCRLRDIAMSHGMPLARYTAQLVRGRAQSHLQGRPLTQVPGFGVAGFGWMRHQAELPRA